MLRRTLAGLNQSFRKPTGIEHIQYCIRFILNSKLANYVATLGKHLHHHELGNTKRHISEDSVLKMCGNPEGDNNSFVKLTTTNPTH